MSGVGAKPGVCAMSEATGVNRPTSGTDKATEFWLWLDDACEGFGDRVNPILVKETRQALKSRQFVVTFSLLLFAALAWTIAGSLSMMPQIYTTPSAQRMLVGYYIVLAIPMLLVVPLAAYRSLEGEIDDGTLELLSITFLSPKQIVLGKLASASLQMLLYFIALFPCVAYAYTLRGVDLPTVMLLMACLLVAGLLLTTIALFFAPLAVSRTGRIATLLAVLLILVIAEYAVAGLSISLILYGNPLTTQWVSFLVVATLLIAIAFGYLLTSAAAAQLTPESENRSTTLRVACTGLSATLLGLAAVAVWSLGNDSQVVLAMAGVSLLMLWTLAGSMMAAESNAMTPRIRRELPSSFLARMFLTWLTPGPTTGIVFASINVVVLGVTFDFLATEFRRQYGVVPLGPRSPGVLRQIIVLVCAYLMGYLVFVRGVMAVVRINNHPRVEIGIAAMVAVSVLGALVPYSVGMHLNDYRAYPYSTWQITNWVWTTHQAVDGNLSGLMVFLIAGFVGIGVLGSVLAAGHHVLPGRIATPDKVKQELARS